MLIAQRQIRLKYEVSAGVHAVVRPPDRGGDDADLGKMLDQFPGLPPSLNDFFQRDINRKRPPNQDGSLFEFRHEFAAHIGGDYSGDSDRGQESGQNQPAEL